MSSLFYRLTRKQLIQNNLRILIMKPKEWTALALLFSGIIMAFTALLMPPPGQIHDSVLYIFAQILIYCGSIFGLDSYISRKLRDMNPPNHPKPL